ncbi:MAG: hypothetical protein ACOX7K_05425 [Oscillospiraceae bacterium]|jgi:hypothetical protein
MSEARYDALISHGAFQLLDRVYNEMVECTDITLEELRFLIDKSDGEVTVRLHKEA